MARRVQIFTLIAITIFLFMSSAGFATAQEQVKLDFWHVMSGVKADALNTLVDKFNKQNPGIKVNPVAIQSHNRRSSNNYHTLYRNIMMSLAKKNPPDVAQSYENWTVQWIEIGALTPVGDNIDKSEMEDYEKDLVPIFKKANTFNGKLWTLPFNKSIYVLYYNKGMFEKAGVKPPKTWEELRIIAKKLTKGEDGKRTVYGLSFEPSVDMFGHYLLAYDGEFIQGNRAVFNSNVGVQNLKYWIHMVHKDRSALASFSDRREFTSGKSAMLIDTTSRIPRFTKNLDFELGVVMLPKGSVRKYQFAGTNLAVFSHLDKKRRKAATKFVQFMTSKESTIFWAKNTGYLPVRKSAINSKEYKQFLMQRPEYKVGIEALNYARVQPKTAAWEMIRGIVDDAMFNAISLRATPENALSRAERMANHLIRNLTGLGR